MGGTRPVTGIPLGHLCVADSGWHRLFSDTQTVDANTFSGGAEGGACEYEMGWENMEI